MAPQKWIATAALLAGTGVIAGAFGAHALKDQLVASDHLETWNTAVLYQVWHALGLLIWAVQREAGRGVGGLGIAGCFVIGTLLFSGSLYCLSLPIADSLPSMFGALTPLGGVFLIAGWGLYGVGSLRRPRAEA
ncbi:MAG: uncharacterized membrane protein YgdD (TMEM256/DUF423 family) [Planctomycetota bacterium]|jgi:uncharacterized membrane protein YgdD (TMEM256/DUF423 family)